MQDDLVQYGNETAPLAAMWQPISIYSAKPYLKAIGLATTLMMMWAGLCAF